MQTMEMIIQKIKKANTESIGVNTQDNQFKCNICEDTGWIEKSNVFTRCECYKCELSERRWKKFGVNPNDIKLINEYVPISEKQKEAKIKTVNYVKNYDVIKQQRNNSITFLGQPGAGKTHLALGIGKALLEREKHVEVSYMPYLEAIRELKSNAMDEENYIKIQSKYLNCELLIIDDLFKDKVKKGKLLSQLSESDMKHIYPIVNHRYINHKPTIYNSECDAEMLIDLDEALAGRILESCKDNIIVFRYGRENNYRIKDL